MSAGELACKACASVQQVLSAGLPIGPLISSRHQ